jgi:hypothetical protein
VDRRLPRRAPRCRKARGRTALAQLGRALVTDLRGDADVIEHELSNKLQKRRRLAAAREALPLFAEKDEAL